MKLYSQGTGEKQSNFFSDSLRLIVSFAVHAPGVELKGRAIK